MDNGNNAPMSLTTTERDALPASKLVAGLLCFNSTTAKLNMYDGSSWVAITSA